MKKNCKEGKMKTYTTENKNHWLVPSKNDFEWKGKLKSRKFKKLKKSYDLKYLYLFVLNLFEFSRTKIFLFKKPKDGGFQINLLYQI